MNSTVVSPVNLGNPHNEVSVKDLALLTQDIIGMISDIQRLPLPENDPKQRRPSIIKARELLGWSPLVSLEQEGLPKTIEYFKNEIHQRKCELASIEGQSVQTDGLRG